jgi:hypothetical protein
LAISSFTNKIQVLSALAGAPGEGLLASSLSFSELTLLGILKCTSRRLHEAAWRAIWRAARPAVAQSSGEFCVSQSQKGWRRT